MFDRYWSYEEIVDYMRELETANPAISQVAQVGRTHEGRDIFGIIITNAEQLGRETLPIVYITAGLVAREWITVMSAVNIIHELIEHYADFSALVDNIEFIIIPGRF